MSTLLQLPNNQTALLLDSDELTNKQVKELRRAASKVSVLVQRLKDLGFNESPSESDETRESTDEETRKKLVIFAEMTDEESDNMDLFQRTCAAVRLVEWSLDLPLPKTADDIDNLPRGIYSVLVEEAAKLDLNDAFDKTLESMQDPKVDGQELNALPSS